MQPLRDTTATPVGRSGDSPSTALILAAGAGTRLLPITNELPKVLVPVHGIPLLVHILRWLADQGVSHVVVNSHHRAEHLAAFLRSVRSPRISLLFEPRLLGSGGTLKALHSFIDTDCYVVYGDVLSNADLRHLSRIHSHSVADVTCLLHAVPDPWNKGVAVTDSSGWITAFLEKPAREGLPSNLAAAGIYIFGRRALDHLPADAPCDIGLHVVPHLLRCHLRIRGVIAGPEVYVRDIGTPESLAAADQDVSRGVIQLHTALSAERQHQERPYGGAHAGASA